MRVSIGKAGCVGSFIIFEIKKKENVYPRRSETTLHTLPNFWIPVWQASGHLEQSPADAGNAHSGRLTKVLHFLVATKMKRWPHCLAGNLPPWGQNPDKHTDFEAICCHEVKSFIHVSDKVSALINIYRRFVTSSLLGCPKNVTKNLQKLALWWGPPLARRDGTQIGLYPD